VVTSPSSTLRSRLHVAGPVVSLPIARDRHHVIVRRLRDEAPQSLFALERWDCAGGDIL
jgi:hypothetical protein